MTQFDHLKRDISGCRICVERFRATETQHEPRPIVWFSKKAPIVIAGQAPGARVHGSGIPFDDPSGDRLRLWLGVDRDQFYDQNKFSILPMAFCFPGYKNGADLPPPAICAKTWRSKVVASLPDSKLTLLVGGYAQKWHLNVKSNVSDTVENWASHGPAFLPLPHPSWRNTGWIKKRPWFERDVIPWLQQRVTAILGEHDNSS